MRSGRGRTAALLALLGVGCSAPPPALPSEALPPPARPEAFSAERAWRHLEALAEMGPRTPGSAGASRAREYLRNELAALGLEVTEQGARIDRAPDDPPLETLNLLAVVPGASGDIVLLVAPYDSSAALRGAEAIDGASGAALLLELGRALQARRPQYSTWLAFVEGDGLPRVGASGAPELLHVGSTALAAGFRDPAGMERVRLAVYFDRLADPDLRIARDLLSSRALREEFWAAARRLGRTAAFPPDAPFESVDAGHRAFAAAGMRRVVALVDTSPGASEPASGAAEDGLAHAPRESLATAGEVSLDALVAIANRLAKIDRFVESPIAPLPEPASPAAEPAATEPASPPAEPTTGPAGP
jgi:hypothetical protein